MLSVNKKFIHSIIDKIQPSIRRTIIKGTLVWGWGWGGGGGALIFHTYFQNFESHYFGGFSENEYFLVSPQNWTIFSIHFYVF